MVILGAAFGAVLVGLSAVSGIVGLTAGFVGIRMLGQGALTLTATTSVALWFERRRGFAAGLTTALGAAGVSFLPVVFERLVSELGWRTAWLVEGIAVWAIVLPIAVFGCATAPQTWASAGRGARRAPRA